MPAQIALRGLRGDALSKRDKERSGMAESVLIKSKNKFVL